MSEMRWTCPACKVTVTTPFCARCGEEPIPPRDLTLRGLAEKLGNALTNIDARAARSAWKLLRHPGELTMAWVSGIRKPYVAPFQLFLLANVLFFAIQWATGGNVFLLLLFCVALLAARLSALLGYGGLNAPIVDNVLSVANLLACSLYVYLAIGPVYGTAGASRVAKALVLAIAVGAIVLGYRFALFFITLYGT